ncbi:Rieske 2Fe-2S domain-containing protein [Arthrobacter sp. JSM 101049]|uniref:Rieske 2Fe-2S domain-containing protein n=1 Tax=Arthrobacter sp. JSM 101049 TaxID=929097 RepID=UPI003566581D
MKRLPGLKVMDRLENFSALDPLVNTARSLVERALGPRWLRDVLHGVPLGHPVHPLAVQVPLGAWVSGGVLDLVPGTERPARILVGTGLLGALPSAAAGYADWSKLHEQQLRVGIVHSASNVLATGLYAASLVQRCRGRHGSGKALSYTGLLLAGAGGYLGGHLAYRQAAGANHTEDIPHRFPTGWQHLAPLDELDEGTLGQRVVSGVPLLVHRRGEQVDVLADTCSHLSAPLHEGRLLDGSGDGPGDACVECPWHQSVFALGTGEVVHGPATAGQPRFETRIVGEAVEVRLPHAG